MIRRVLIVIGLATLSFSLPVHGQNPTPGEGDLIISEIMYAPDGPDTDREYIELYNATDRAIDLEGWTLVTEDPETSDPLTDDIASSVVVDANSFAVLCENAAESENGGIRCAFDYPNSINHENTADHIVLRRPDGTEVDRVHYDENSGWPNAVGASLEFTMGPTTSNNDPENWQIADERAGDYAEASGPNDGSPNANTPQGQLPVELVSFTASLAEGRALLRWTTASERNNAGFRIQHRRPGVRSWSSEGFVPGTGTSTRAHSYRFSTAALGAGTHYFRLQQVDTDGTTHLSSEKSVHVRSSGGLSIKGPNPLRPGQRLSITSGEEEASTISIALYDVLGRRVRARTTRSVRPGRRVHVRATDLPSGTYLLYARGRGREAVRKITVVK